MNVYLGELQVSNASRPGQFYLHTTHLCVFFCSHGETFSEEAGYKRKVTKTNSLICKRMNLMFIGPCIVLIVE